MYCHYRQEIFLGFYGLPPFPKSVEMTENYAIWFPHSGNNKRTKKVLDFQVFIWQSLIK